MKIAEKQVIRNDMIFINENIESKDNALQFLTEKSQEAGVVTHKKIFLDTVLMRENMVSTAVGYQIAMPHGKSDVVKQPFVGFLRTVKKFIWSDDDNELVNMIFLIGVPIESEDNVHLKVISQLSKQLLDDVFRNQLENLDDINQIYTLLSSLNKNF